MSRLGIYASAITGNLVTNSYESIATVTVGAGGAATVSFTSIPSTYKHLEIRSMARDARAISGANPINMAFNSDTTVTNYRQHYLYGDGSATGAGTAQGTGTYASGGDSAGASNGASIFAVNVISILDYTNTNKNKVSRVLHGIDTNGGGQIVLDSSLWLNTAAITQIDLTAKSSSGFVQYSSFALYGIKG